MRRIASAVSPSCEPASVERLSSSDSRRRVTLPTNWLVTRMEVEVPAKKKQATEPGKGAVKPKPKKKTSRGK